MGSKLPCGRSLFISRRHQDFYNREAIPLKKLFCIVTAVGLTAASSCLFAAGVSGELARDIEEVYVGGDATPVLANSEAASVGTVLAAQIAHRPALRPAELLETIPGMVVTQHSGDGKANQYFLRGFNLDHGSDFANYVEGVPVNMVSHGHGQGYTDLNFLIPELVERIVYRKGPYYAEAGDFASAGSARTAYKRKVEKQTVKLSVGENGYGRMLAYGGVAVADGQLVYAIESMKNDGPWVVAEGFDKKNGVLKYSSGDDDRGYSVTALAYEADWTSTDQVPQRLVDDGSLDRYGSLDDSTGGDTHRYSLSANMWSQLSDTLHLDSQFYVFDYALRLTSNASYFSRDDVDDPDFRGDQFTQFDNRLSYGGQLDFSQVLNSRHELNYGAELRLDDINDVGVGFSQQALIYDLFARAAIDEIALGVYGSVHSQWTDWFATIAGLRYQTIDVSVDAKRVGDDEGDDREALLSPKLSLRFGPFANTEFFVNYGEGFHSNDARGVVRGGSAANTVPLMSESTGYELGMRSLLARDVQVSLVLFRLDLDSELVFVGDESTTEPRDATRRQGVELSVFYQPVDWFVLDVDYAASNTRFKNQQFDGATALGKNVPDSVENVFAMGASVELDNGVYGGVRLRYFGPRKLTEGGDIESDASQILNANLGYRFDNGVSLGLEVINVLDDSDDDITYYYASRTASERTAGIDPIDDFHSHPMEPRTLRASLSFEF